MHAMGSVCKSQNFGERKSTSSAVRAGIESQALCNTETVRALIHEPYALPIALARSYESFVLSEMEDPSDCKANKADWASSCVGLMLRNWRGENGKLIVTPGSL
jgi:hypothetical protein